VGRKETTIIVESGKGVLGRKAKENEGSVPIRNEKVKRPRVLGGKFLGGMIRVLTPRLGGEKNKTIRSNVKKSKKKAMHLKGAGFKGEPPDPKKKTRGLPERKKVELWGWEGNRGLWEALTKEKKQQKKTLGGIAASNSTRWRVRSRRKRVQTRENYLGKSNRFRK